MSSTNAPRIAVALPAHPGRRVAVPVVLAAAQQAGSLAQATRATVPVDGGQHRIAHERAATPQAGDGIDLGDDCIVEFNVHSHVLKFNT